MAQAHTSLRRSEVRCSPRKPVGLSTFHKPGVSCVPQGFQYFVRFDRGEPRLFMSDTYIQNLLAERIGGRSYGKSNAIYKFEKIKRAKRAALTANPGAEIIDMG